MSTSFPALNSASLPNTWISAMSGKRLLSPGCSRLRIGGGDVLIQDFDLSCACTHIEPNSLSIPPNTTREVRATLDLTTKSPGLQPGQVEGRRFEVLIRPRLQPQVPEQQLAPWRLVGRVRPLIGVQSRVIDLGRCSDAAKPPPQNVVVASALPLRGLRATPSSSRLSCQVREVGDQRTRFELGIEPRAGIPAGDIRERITLTPVSDDGQALPETYLQVKGRVVPDIQCSPQGLLIQAAPGAGFEESVTLFSLSGRPFDVAEVVVEDRAISVVEFGMASRGQHVYLVKRAVDSGDARPSEVHFRVRVGDEDVRTATLPISYVPAASRPCPP
jgi:hypothetical protein